MDITVTYVRLSLPEKIQQGVSPHYNSEITHHHPIYPYASRVSRILEEQGSSFVLENEQDSSLLRKNSSALCLGQVIILPSEWINSSTTFLFLDVDGKISANHHPEIDTIRAQLNKQGIESAYYLNNRIPSLIKLIDDLEALGSHNIVFFCIPSNYRLSKIVSRRLKEADQPLKVVWFGPLIGVLARDILQQEDANACTQKLSADTLMELLNNWQNISSNTELPENVSITQLPMNGQSFHENVEESINVHMSLVDYTKACSGLYSPLDLRGYVQHLFCSESEITHLPKCQNYSDINCGVIAASSKQRKDISSVYNQFQTLTLVKNCYYRYLYQENSMGSFTLSIGNNFIGPNILRLPYEQARQAPKTELCLLTIDNSGDLAAFVNDAQHFFETGRLSKDYELTTVLQDSCRWMGKGHCHVKNLPRLYSRKEKLSPCRDSSITIGTAGEEFHILKDRLHSFVERTLVQRKCFECSAQWCPQCSFLPDFLDNSQYCALMRLKPWITTYLETKSILRVLRNTSGIFRAAKVTDLKISTPRVSHFLPITRSGGKASPISKHVYLFTVKDTPYVFNASSKKLVKINEPLSMIFEALLKSVDLVEIQSILSHKYKQNPTESANYIRQTLDKFHEAGFVSKGA